MTVDLLPIQGLKLITLKRYSDVRGFFCERFKSSDFKNIGLPTEFRQDNFSRSLPSVLRGLHYQWDLPQGKLVTCLRGTIFDVVVDLRKNSPTFGQHISIELDGDRPQWFWIPAGFAHGFCVLGNQETDVYYQCDQEYNAKGESGIRWNDPELKINWPNLQFIISPKDQEQGTFKDYSESPRFF